MGILKNLGHDLYQTGSYDAPPQIQDKNGEVVLALCRRCKKAEAELWEKCPACASGVYSGLPGGACDKCMNRGQVPIPCLPPEVPA